MSLHRFYKIQSYSKSYTMQYITTSYSKKNKRTYSCKNIECLHKKLPAFLVKTFNVSDQKAGSFLIRSSPFSDYV